MLGASIVIMIFVLWMRKVKFKSLLHAMSDAKNASSRIQTQLCPSLHLRSFHCVINQGQVSRQGEGKCREGYKQVQEGDKTQGGRPPPLPPWLKYSALKKERKRFQCTFLLPKFLPHSPAFILAYLFDVSKKRMERSNHPTSQEAIIFHSLHALPSSLPEGVVLSFHLVLRDKLLNTKSTDTPLC